MTRHIKLTRDITGFYDPAVWVFFDHIVYLHGNGAGTTLRLENGFCLDVKEYPAEVLALIDRADTIIIDAKGATP